MAGGAFVVYIIQVTNPVCNTLFAFDQYALSQFSYTFYQISLVLFSIVFYALCLLYNEVIQMIIRPILNPLGIQIEN